ncbi:MULTISPECIES: helix-turn-helix transcriptional regulator [Aeromonas]|uniref:LuxR family transcriptional regulator n=2 Tax=Aeromonas media TaxID=651 RepID=A0AAE7AEL0_AERME|nr:MULTISPECIES: LuxR C-terminal-related transcriptional regulator [Aeromonas]MBS4638578.1 LuxR family transcriptional regulator [Aeromonas media]QJT29290.1 LuxR family transcriptional regulator [Aeromonas media]QJT36095.1 LuxR family transcriptional regulator [Aeromonas media]QJT37924.1 LuxR family transcriptional regulator [Aeromonas media]WED80864.1 LuxR C-terminal-related transcriptional regulator [Aeromonas media]
MSQPLATDSLTQSLTAVVDALHSPAFAAALVRLIQQQVAFDCALLLGVGLRPVYLHDNLSHQRALLFDRYLTSHFSQDPFMQALQDGLPAGVWTLAQVSKGRLDPEYRHHFYQATGWQEEVGLILPVRDGFTLMLFLGRLDKRQALRPDERARLEALFPLVHSLCRQQWREAVPLLAQNPARPDGSDLKATVEQAIASVGGDRLTRRERQVAGLLLQGLDTEAIAAELGIGSGTVKNHRKHLYGKLRLGSRAELFSLFLNHLITTPLSPLPPEEPAP